MIKEGTRGEERRREKREDTREERGKQGANREERKEDKRRRERREEKNTIFFSTLITIGCLIGRLELRVRKKREGFL